MSAILPTRVTPPAEPSSPSVAPAESSGPGGPPPKRSVWAMWGKILGTAFVIGILLFACSMIYSEVEGMDRGKVLEYFHNLSVWQIGSAIFLTVCSYLLLTSFDFLALRYLGRSLPFRHYGFVSFTAYVMSYNIGLSVVGAGAIRLRYYPRWGITKTEIAKIMTFCLITYWLGLFALAGMLLMFLPPALPADFPMPPHLLTWVGAGMLVPVILYLVVGHWKSSVRLWRWRIEFPSLRVSVAQIIVSAVDLTLGAAVLYCLLPPGTTSFGVFLSAYLLAFITSITLHVPAGAGILDAILLVQLSDAISTPELLGALAMFRVIYFLLPLLVALALMGSYEIRNARRKG